MKIEFIFEHSFYLTENIYIEVPIKVVSSDFNDYSKTRLY